MAKRQSEIEREEEQRRLSRKEVLIARKNERQNRQIRIAVGIIVGLLVIVFAVALVVEYVVRPNQPVAEVGEATIALNEWRDRVRYTRAQFIIDLEDQLAIFQDVSLVQQFRQQQIQLLLQPEVLGELVLEQMIDEAVVKQAADERGIDVSDADVEERIAEQFNYFGGAVPTPRPTGTATIMPTPSLTPIPTAVITDLLPTNTPAPEPTAGPTGTPRPTATPVSEEAYATEYETLIGRFEEMGVSEETFRSAVRAQLYQEKLAEALADEEELSREAEHASLFLIAADSEEDSTEVRELVEEEGFLTVWNRIRSTPPDAGEEDTIPATAQELLWRTQDQIEQQFGPAIASAAFSLDLDTPSDVLLEIPAQIAADEPLSPRYIIIQVSGREERELADAAYDTLQRELVTELVAELRDSLDVETSSLWRARVPQQPILDPSFLVQPEPQQQPTIPVVAPTAEAEPAGDE